MPIGDINLTGLGSLRWNLIPRQSPCKAYTITRQSTYITSPGDYCSKHWSSLISSVRKMRSPIEQIASIWIGSEPPRALFLLQLHAGSLAPCLAPCSTLIWRYKFPKRRFISSGLHAVMSHNINGTSIWPFIADWNTCISVYTSIMMGFYVKIRSEFDTDNEKDYRDSLFVTCPLWAMEFACRSESFRTKSWFLKIKLDNFGIVYLWKELSQICICRFLDRKLGDVTM